jgi:hypothetical protein
VLWREYTVMGYDVDAVEDGYLRGMVKTKHSSEGIRSPIQLYVNDRVRNAIERISRTAHTDSHEQIWWETRRPGNRASDDSKGGVCLDDLHRTACH